MFAPSQLNERYILRGHLQVGMPHHLRDCGGNWDHLDLIFPVYLKLMTGFPSFQPEDVGAELLH